MNADCTGCQLCIDEDWETERVEAGAPLCTLPIGESLPCHTANDQTPRDGLVAQAEPRNRELLFVTTII